MRHSVFHNRNYHSTTIPDPTNEEKLHAVLCGFDHAELQLLQAQPEFDDVHHWLAKQFDNEVQ